MVKYEYIECKNPNGNHRMAYTQWGNPENNQVLICVHGFSRTGRDFDYLAATLSEKYRIICPDIVGRGKSDRLSNSSDYGLPLYISDMLTLINQLNLSNIDWIGTSMGGLIGMFIASQKNSLINRLVMNDIGAEIVSESLKRWAKKYLTQGNFDFENLNQVTEYVREFYSDYGALTDSEWEHIAKYTVKNTSEGKYKLHYDLSIIDIFRVSTGELKPVDFWETWSSVNCPVLLLHGEESYLLLPETIEKMQSIHPQITIKHFPCGHNPPLLSTDQIEAIANWLS
ncbi:alpha/beta hydrolase [Okeania sp.]|uniref:alpha/beta fold hydrolase n=1 Tax=Okeania sp. TaxID=3100323 RepID=UPI002B4ADAFE|nr:alpha/beta hydrolase [Okeania sp.]MEB3341022.1 alpha/beta hydrolase [Okeania sp.]